MADKDRDEQEPAFKVTDHRRVHLDDEPGAPPRPSQAAMDDAARRADAAADEGPRRPAPEMDFTTFVLSLGSSALVHLGDSPHPDTHAPEPNLTMAKQTIDMLAMLRDKTQGNLDRDEASYLDALLYDLRLRYVEATKRH